MDLHTPSCLRQVCSCGFSAWQLNVTNTQVSWVLRELKRLTHWHSNQKIKSIKILLLKNKCTTNAFIGWKFQLRYVGRSPFKGKSWTRGRNHSVLWRRKHIQGTPCSHCTQLTHLLCTPVGLGTVCFQGSQENLTVRPEIYHPLPTNACTPTHTHTHVHMHAHTCTHTHSRTHTNCGETTLHIHSSHRMRPPLTERGSPLAPFTRKHLLQTIHRCGHLSQFHRQDLPHSCQTGNIATCKFTGSFISSSFHTGSHLQQLSHRESSPAAFTQGKSSLAAFTQEGSTLADFSHRKDHL